jgi:hypothetical protein
MVSNYNKSIMPDRDNKAAIKILIQTLELNPELWETRKKTAEILFDEERYVEAADVLWSAPEIPSTDIDVAFTIKIISRARPNRAIRMIYEIVRRNDGKPAKNMAVARALNEIGMYMQASRFYGAALASEPSLFDLGFERQALWLDDSNRLIDEWQKSDPEFKPPLDVPRQDIHGGTITPVEIPEELAGLAQTDNIQIPVVQEDQATIRPNPFVASPPVPAQAITPIALQPNAVEAETAATPSSIKIAASSSVLAPVLAQAVPTQPLQVESVKATPESVKVTSDKEPIPPLIPGDSITGKFLTPVSSDGLRRKLM